MLVSCTGHLINDRYYRTYLQTAAQKQIRMPPTQNIPRTYLLLLRELDTACTDSPESLVIFFFYKHKRQSLATTDGLGTRHSQ